MFAFNFGSVFTIIVIVNQAYRSNAWELPWVSSNADDASPSVQDTNNLDKAEVSGNANVNPDFMEELLEEEDIEDEENLRCAESFDRNLYRVLKSMMPANYTEIEREGRQEDTDQLVASLLDIDDAQVFGGVLNLVRSAATSNATAIEESYKVLPYVVRSGVTDLLKFFTELLIDESEFLSS